MDSAAPLNDINRHYAVVLTLTEGSSGVGFRNLGYDGICLVSGQTYDFSIYVNSAKGRMKVRLVEDKDVLAEQELTISGNGWGKITCELKPSRKSQKAALEILFPDKGIYSMDMVSLFPRNTFRNRPNGLRLDLAQALEALHPALIRFPGGCLAHGDGLANIYRWKETIGPVEKRLEQPNIWNYRQSRGLGYYEYLQFCEDIGAEPLPVMAAGVSCQNSARSRGTGQEAIPMEEMKEFIQDIIDLVEFCNGDENTTWGRKRAEAGHPAPFNLKYIGIGNEDRMTAEFDERFALICRSLKEKCPEIKIIGTSGPAASGEDFDKGWEAARKANV